MCVYISQYHQSIAPQTLNMAEYFHEKTIDSAATMFSLSLRNMPSPSALFSAYASMSASVVLFKSMFNQLIPLSVQHRILSAVRCYLKPRSSLFTLVIEDSAGMRRNELFDAAELYLCAKISPDTERLRISKTPNDKNLTTAFAQSEKIVDSFNGIELKWRFLRDENQKRSNWGSDLHQEEGGNNHSEKQWFELSFDKEHKGSVLGSYLPFVLDKAKEIRDSRNVAKLHTILNSSFSNTKWESIEFEHPSTFDTIAMDTELKREIIDDLDRFVKRREFYRKVGKAWKRGYLLYGPPGTGKSSLIAAMANYLKFDIYDLQLANVSRDSELRKVLLSTANRSILVVEDIDCSTNKFPDRLSSKCGDHASVQLTLSGLLNFIDGLWSSCGDERIIIFTTNHKEKLDPALLRPGRMDMHIHLSYCTIDGFKVLASNYLDIPADGGDSHHQELIGKVEELIGNAQVTPAQVAEELMKSDDASVSLQGLVNFLKRKRMESNEAKVEETEQEGSGAEDEDAGAHEIDQESRRQKTAHT